MTGPNDPTPDKETDSEDPNVLTKEEVIEYGLEEDPDEE